MTVKTTIAFAIGLSLTSFISNAKINSLASEEFSHLKVAFKIATVEGATGTNEINNGEFTKSIKTSTSMIGKSDDLFGTSMSLCVAHLKVGAFKHADAACTSAIKAISDLKSKPTSPRNIDYLTSVAYSNRGIVHHYLGDKTSAFNDFNTAMSIDDNRIVKHNLTALNIATLRNEIKAIQVSE